MYCYRSRTRYTVFDVPNTEHVTVAVSPLITGVVVTVSTEILNKITKYMKYVTVSDDSKYGMTNMECDTVNHMTKYGVTQ